MKGKKYSAWWLLVAAMILVIGLVACGAKNIDEVSNLVNKETVTEEPKNMDEVENTEVSGSAEQSEGSPEDSEQSDAKSAVEEVEATAVPEIMEKPVVTEAPAAAEEPEATDSPKSTDAPKPTDEPKTTDVPKPTETPKPTEAPKPTDSPIPTETPKPTEEPKPTETPGPTATPSPTVSPKPTEVPEEEIVLFSGRASVKFTSWDNWEKAVSLERSEFDLESIEKPFTVKVYYESDAVPMLIFMSWTGGTGWAQMPPFYASEGVAYYTYDVITQNYGEDFSNLDRIQVMPYGTDLTVTKISVVKEKAKEDIEVVYTGRAGEIVNDISAGWNLGNTLDSCGEWIDLYTDAAPVDFETAWGNPETTEKMIQDIKEAGFNAIRVPVTWSQHIDDVNGYQIDEAWMARVQEIVDYVIDNDMYCVLNVHHDTGTDGWLRASTKNVEENRKKFVALWTQIANRFKEYDDKLLFEGFNEILNEESNWGYPGADGTTAVNLWNQIFVDVVRATGGNNAKRVLVVNTYAASTDNGILDEFELPKDSAQDSLIVGLHHYSPVSYCFEMSGNENTQTVWTENGGKTMQDSILYSAYMHFTKQGIPVIISEFAASNKDNESDRAQWADYFTESAAQYGMKCFWWDAGGTFEKDAELGYYKGMSLYNRYENRWEFSKIVEAIVGI